MSGTQDHANAQDTHAEGHDAHEGPIKTPKQLIVAVFFAFVIPIVIIVMLANYVSSEIKPGAGGTGLEGEAVAARIQPVGSIELKDLTNPAAMKSGEQVFQAQCSACHATGAAGAPKLGDHDAWGPRVKSGFDTLVHSALKGKGNMGPQGGGDFSDFEISRAVVYMANQGGAKFDEPKLPAAAASGADAGASAPAAPASGASQ
ncbi:c-type cytochrome [Roseateles chitinivorans]|uniref:c-type cytochrome n=1 Tax=Roseateles chitinivorans TaxID=2917965 RepID=UPI003D679949